MAEIIKNYDNGSSIKVVYSYTQDVAKNQSTITMTLYVKRDAYGPSWNTRCNAYIQLDSTKAMTYAGSFKIGVDWVKIGSTVSRTVTHSADGTKTVSIKGFFDSLGLTSKLENLTASGSVKLTTIPRASSISSISGNTIGSPVTINISREVSSFTHKVYYSFGDTKNYLIDDNVGTSVTFTPSMNDCKYLPNATSGTAAIRVDTYSGSTKVGSVSKNFTLNVPGSVVPTFTGITFTRIDGTVPASWGVYVKTKSKVKAAISGAAGVYGSTIKSYSISGGGYSGAASSLTTGFLNTAGTITFTAKITDSRGRIATKTASIAVVDYSAPTITSTSAYRCNASGTAQDDGTYVALTANFSGATVSGKNTISGKYRYRSGSGAWSGLVALTSGVKKVVSGISAESTYTFEVQVSDAFTTISKQMTINSAEFIMDFKAGGNGAAFGKAAEETDTLDCGWKAKFRKSVYMDNQIAIWGKDPETGDFINAFEAISGAGSTVIGRGNFERHSGDTFVFGNNVILEPYDTLFIRKKTVINQGRGIYALNSDGEECLVIEPKATSGNTVIGRYNYENKKGDTYIGGNNVMISVGQCSTQYRPYYRKGDAIIITLHTAGYVTTSGTEMFFAVPIAREIIGNPVITASSVSGIIVRQNNKYLYGSSAETGAKPSGYTAYYENGILRIMAKFSNTTNVENNSPVGIYWYGRVTLS